VSEKIDYLRTTIGDRKDVWCFVGDANEKLLNDVLPKIKYTDFKRGLCVLDPYGLHLDWKVIHAAGQARSIEIFLNFPVADMNRNVFWRNVKGVDERDIDRMNLYWGDDSWRNVAYTTDTNLFGFPERTDNETIAAAFKDRLAKEAGFQFVPEPLPMKNDQGAVVYYLYFASHNAAGSRIATDIFKKYRK
jgi:three-Cys-motif partner protein